MTTRCQIGFYEAPRWLESPQVLIYKHYDGYPDTENGVIAVLLPFLNWFNKARGVDDLEYCAFNLAYYLKAKQTADTIKYETERNEKEPEFSKFTSISEFNGINFDLLGYGISKSFHGDIDWYYAIYPDRIDVYQIITEPDSETEYEELCEDMPIEFYKTFSIENEE